MNQIKDFIKSEWIKSLNEVGLRRASVLTEKKLNYQFSRSLINYHIKELRNQIKKRN